MPRLTSSRDRSDVLRHRNDAEPLPGLMRVLVVEDDFFQANAIRDLITTAGKPRIAVTLAGSLEFALELIRKETFDIVLLDLMLPDAKGLEGLSRVVQIAPRLPVLILTGLGKEDLVVRAFEHGAQDYLIKGDGDGDELLRAMVFAARRKAAELRRLELARRDPLTGLANRAVLLERMQRAKQRADRDGRLFALLFLDLDGFKRVNDGRGHMAGDRVLRTVARRLAAVTRQVDTVARVGGDEFVILVESLGDGADAAGIADKLLDSIGRPITIDGHALEMTGSIGISIYPQDAADGERLMALADGAMYEAKRTRGHHVFASHGLAQNAPGLVLAAG